MASPDKKKILLPLDGSDQSLFAVKYLAQIMPSDLSEIVLFHVFQRVPEVFRDLEKDPRYPVQIINSGTWETKQRDKVAQFMSKARDILLLSGVSPQAIEIRIKDQQVGIARDIAALAQSGYHVLIMGHRGTNNLSDLLIGSVAYKLLGTLRGLHLCVVKGNPKNNKFLVGLDTSSGSAHAVDFLASFLRGAEALVTLLHVQRSLSSTTKNTARGEILPEAEEKWREDVRQVMEPIMTESKTRLVAIGLPEENVNTKIIFGADSRAWSIAEEARSGGYGTILVGRHGVSEVANYLMGRVSHKVIYMASNAAVWVIN